MISFHYIIYSTSALCWIYNKSYWTNLRMQWMNECSNADIASNVYNRLQGGDNAFRRKQSRQVPSHAHCHARSSTTWMDASDDIDNCANWLHFEKSEWVSHWSSYFLPIAKKKHLRKEQGDPHNGLHNHDFKRNLMLHG